MASKKRFESTVRARINPQQEAMLREIAAARDVNVSVIVREALRLYIFHHPLATISKAELVDV